MVCLSFVYQYCLQGQLRPYLLGPSLVENTVKSHFKALGLYIFIRGFGWAYKQGEGGLISGWAYKRNKKMFRNEKIKHI